MTLDRHLLRYLLAVADHGRFSRAADACHVTQPTLSAGIARLERLVGERMFERSNRRVALTEAGARLERGRIDAALTMVDEDALFDEGYALALPADHPLAARETIAAEEVAGEVMLVRRHCEALAATSRHFTARGVRPFMAARTDDDARALAFVAAGLGITVMPDGFVAPGVARVAMAGFDRRRTIGLLRGTAPHDAALDRIGEAVLAARRP